MKSHDQRLDTVVEVIATGYRAVESYQWKAADAMVTNLGAVAEPTSEHIKAEVEAILSRLALYGIELAEPTVRAWWYIGSINPPEVRNGVSFTSAQECGTDERRFAWFKEFGAGLSKRQVRELRGKRTDRVGGKGATTKQKITDALSMLSEIEDEDEAEKVLAELIEDEDLRTMISTLLRKQRAAKAKASSKAGRDRNPEAADPVDLILKQLDAALGNADRGVLLLAEHGVTEASREAIGGVLYEIITKCQEGLTLLGSSDMDTELEHLIREAK